MHSEFDAQYDEEGDIDFAAMNQAVFESRCLSAFFKLLHPPSSVKRRVRSVQCQHNQFNQQVWQEALPAFPFNVYVGKGSQLRTSGSMAAFFKPKFVEKLIDEWQTLHDQFYVADGSLQLMLLRLPNVAEVMCMHNGNPEPRNKAEVQVILPLDDGFCTLESGRAVADRFADIFASYFQSAV